MFKEDWCHYFDLEPIRRLRNEGRELLGKSITMTEKRDGENVSVWLDKNGGMCVSSHSQCQASQDIINHKPVVAVNVGLAIILKVPCAAMYTE